MFAPFRPTIAALALVVLTAASPVLAVDALQQAAATAASAREAYDAADYSRAAALYLTAWQSAPGQVGLLYNSARAAHLAGQLQFATERYLHYLAIPERDKSVDAKVNGYLDEMRVRVAEQHAEAGDRALAAADSETAVTEYHQAVTALPNRVEWLAKLAQAEESRGNKDAARTHWRLFLAKTTADSPGHAVAEQRLAALDKPTTPAPSPSTPMGRLPGWIGVGLGAATGVTAVIMAGVAATQQSTLNAKLAEHDASGAITGIGYAQAQADHDAIGRMKTASLFTGLVGVALAGAGVAWILTHGDAQVTFAPGPGFGTLTARF
jgi:tetratricopeptide (TPR) repeat protein